MRLTQWLQNKTLVKAARQLSETDTFRKMREVLEEESPLHRFSADTGPSADDRSHRLGQIEGYQLCLDNLRMLATQPPPRPKEIEQTYPSE